MRRQFSQTARFSVWGIHPSLTASRAPFSCVPVPFSATFLILVLCLQSSHFLLTIDTYLIISYSIGSVSLLGDSLFRRLSCLSRHYAASTWWTDQHCSPIGLVSRPRSNQWHMIVDLSFPGGRSVNDAINETACSLQYASIDDAINLIQVLGPGTQLLKMDLKGTYQIVPIHPHDQHLLAVVWQNEAYVDRAQSSLCPQNFHSSSRSIRNLMPWCPLPPALSRRLFFFGVTSHK